MDELVTHSLEDYQATALLLARHPAKLTALREKLAANRPTCALFDTALGTRHIEAAYAAMMRRVQAGLPPMHLDIPHL
jgi:predicted O-linked N-acetylglucosamine transferase (SPINDLY family)